MAMKGKSQKETDSLLIAPQKIAIRINYIKVKIDDMLENSRYSLHGDKDETIDCIISECIKLAQKEYNSRYDWI